MLTAFVVESVARDQAGARVGMFRVYVATEARAREVSDAGAGRTWREMPIGEVPEKARAALEQARPS